MTDEPFDPRVTPARADLAARHLEGRVRAARFTDGTVRRVIAPNAPLKSRPESGAAYASEILFGEIFTVYEDRDGWAWGQLQQDGYVGYVPTAALAPEPVDAKTPPTHWLKAAASHIYPAPDLKRPPLMPLYCGSRLILAATEPENGFLPLANGGWIYAAHLRPLGDWTADFVSEAERFVGAPYLWGGRTVSGIDCSGLLQLALGTSGMSIPRDTDQQAASVGRLLPPSEKPIRGDIVFFPGHVGIMTDSAHLLHANATHMAVTIDPLETVIAIVARNRKNMSDPPVTGIRRIA